MTETLAVLISRAGEIDEAALDPYQRAYLRAKRSKDAEAFRLLVRAVAATLPTGVHSTRGISKLIRIHFGSPISLVSVRSDLRCTMAQVYSYRDAVKASMTKIRAGLKVELVRQCATENVIGRAL